MPSAGPPLSTAMLDAAVEMIGRAGLRGSVAVAGVSMHPTFAGVRRLAVEFAPRQIGFGDVVVFRQRGKLVVHRVALAGVGGGKLKTRGDRTIAFDPPVDPEDVVGRVFAVEYADGSWRGIRGRRARLYARCLGAHVLCWGQLGVLAHKTAGPDWQWRVGRLDQFKLDLVHLLLFRLFNPRIEAPVLDAVSGHAEARCYTSPFEHRRGKHE